MEFRKFDELESKILALVARAQELAGQKDTLAASLEKAELELMAAQDRVKELETERVKVLEKVDALLSRLE